MELNFLEIFGAIVGLIYLWLGYRAGIYLWITGIVMPVVYIFVYYKTGLYADFGINICYLIAAIYSWFFWMWGHRRKKDQLTTVDVSTGDAPRNLPIVHTPGRCYLPFFLVFVISFLGIAWILIVYTGNNILWLDSLTTALSIVGMQVLTRRYVEQWSAWILVGIICCGLYIYEDLHFISALYGLYSIIAVFGCFRWKELMSIR